jgi:RNA polymerase sporulation-specific sigma factor
MAAVSRSGTTGAHGEELLHRVAVNMCRRYGCWKLLEELISAGEVALSLMRHEAGSGPGQEGEVSPAGELIRCVRRSNDAMICRLVEENAGLVHHIATKFRGRGSDSYDDLVQIGMDAFIACARKYQRPLSLAVGTQGRRTAKLTTVAYKHIRWEILNYLGENAFNGLNVSRRDRERAKRVRQLHNEIMQTGREPSKEEIAATLGMSVQEVETALHLIALDDEPEPLWSIHDEGPSPEEAAAQHERLEVLERAIATLPRKYRDPILLVYFEGLSVEEVARRSGCPVSTIKSHCRRGLAMLQKKLRGLL